MWYNVENFLFSTFYVEKYLLTLLSARDPLLT
jgi:hypothetical protein